MSSIPFDVVAQKAHSGFVAQLTDIVGEANVAQSQQSRRVASQDVYRSGELPLAVVAPASTDEVSAVVKASTQAGVAVFVRGGGMSYTDAFLPDRADSIVLSTERLTAIREINAQDLFVTVESGCTWAALDEALKPHDVRCVFWGPMSGGVSTVGGAMAQGAVTFGSSKNGSSMAAAVGLEVVLADGSIAITGSAAQPNHSAFYREYGPDMTGLFCGDCGALGVKTAVTIRLEPRPNVGAGLSFSFNDFASLTEAVGRVTRHGLATEVFGAETALVKSVAGDANLKNDFGQLMTIMRGAPNAWAALKNGFKAAIGGRRFLKGSSFLVNFLAEGYDNRQLASTLQRIRHEVGDRGVEIANTMAEFTRAMPFPEPAVLGPNGKRLLPLHAVVPYSKAAGLQADVDSYLQSIKSQCEEHRVEVYVVYATCGSAGFLYETVMYWEDEWLDIHRITMSDDVLASFSEPARDDASRDLVENIRVRTIDIMYEHGATHFQIGKAYPYTRERDATSLDVLREVKRRVDPYNLLNPGALGLISHDS
ncbi:MAG: FAD-binding oxidoreductase [Pseudomonadota bacterium]